MKTLAGKIKLLALVIILGGILVTSIVGCSPTSNCGLNTNCPNGYTPDQSGRHQVHEVPDHPVVVKL
jgi:hypothetical protein